MWNPRRCGSCGYATAERYSCLLRYPESFSRLLYALQKNSRVELYITSGHILSVYYFSAYHEIIFQKQTDKED